MQETPIYEIPQRLLDPDVVLILDENVQVPESDKKSERYMNLTEIRMPGTPDWVVLEEAKERNGIIITRDKGLALRAVLECYDIIYESPWGDRFYLDGITTKLIASGQQIRAA